MGKFETKKTEFLRKGEIEKAKWLENIDKTILPSYAKRIQQNDKTVLKELVVPRWVGWDILYDWALSKKSDSGHMCILCNLNSENGIHYVEKFICESCFLKIKTM